MTSTKLVKNLFLLILCCANVWHINGMRINNEEEDTPPDAHIVYDQRQTGKYNIHVVIKDVAIIEMDQNEIAEESYNDQDYYYDEEDLTVKPLIIKTSTTSMKPLDCTSNSNKSTPIMETTTSTGENRNNETTTNTPQQTSATNATIANTTYKKFNKNVADFMTLFATHRPPVDTKSRSKIEPIYAIDEPILQPSYRIDDLNYDTPIQAQSRHSTLVKDESNIFPNSRIFKVKVHRSQRQPQILPQKPPCRSHQYRDSRGNCRVKRSSSGSIL